MHRNNFDLIRLIAAVQVLVLHSTEHLGLQLPDWVLSILGIFPGVPIFFVISGFLIADAYRRDPVAKTFFMNRALRIFPALWGCFIFGFVAITFFERVYEPKLLTILLFVVGNLVGLPHTPTFLKDYGAGSFNGSLWTIPVELQFYVALPLLLLTLGTFRRRWMIAIVLAIALNLLYLWYRDAVGPSILVKFFRYSVTSWLYMFMLGMALQANWNSIDSYFERRFVWWLIGYLVWVALLDKIGVRIDGNTITPLSALPLSCVIVSAAFTKPNLAAYLLHRDDISYGIYLYHMPVVNIALERGWRGDWVWFWGCTAATVVLAWLSWRLVERPALALKKRTTRQHHSVLPQSVTTTSGQK